MVDTVSVTVNELFCEGRWLTREITAPLLDGTPPPNTPFVGLGGSQCSASGGFD